MFAFDCQCKYVRDVVDMILGWCCRFMCNGYQTSLSFRTIAERYMGGGEEDSLRQSELVCTRSGAKRSQELCAGRGEIQFQSRFSHKSAEEEMCSIDSRRENEQERRREGVEISQARERSMDRDMKVGSLPGRFRRKRSGRGSRRAGLAHQPSTLAGGELVPSDPWQASVGSPAASLDLTVCSGSDCWRAVQGWVASRCNSRIGI